MLSQLGLNGMCLKMLSFGVVIEILKSKRVIGMKLLDRYIISKNLDALAFTSFIPVFLIAIAMFRFDFFNLGTISPVTYFLVLGIVIDGSHNYATFFSSYLDPKMRERLKGKLASPRGKKK